jgi:hypothetical protein
MILPCVSFYREKASALRPKLGFQYQIQYQMAVMRVGTVGCKLIAPLFPECFARLTWSR